MNYEEAYDDLLKQLMATLETVGTNESARLFNAQAANSVRAAAEQIPEFYIGEFLRVLADAVVKRMQTEMKAGERAIKDAQMEAAAASVELTARYTAARAAGDRAAEHILWGEREKIQAANQAKVDAVSARLDILALRLKAVEMLRSTFGFKGGA